MGDNTTPALYAIKLVDVLRKAGVDVQSLLHEAGITAGELSHREHPVPIKKYLALVTGATRDAEIDDLGFVVGEQTGILEHGVLAYAMLSSATLNECLLRYTRYQGLVGPLLEVSLHVEGAEARMCVEPRREALDLDTPVLRYFLQEWLATWNPWSALIRQPGPFFSRVEIGLPDSGMEAIYARYLKCPVSFHPGPSVARFPANHLSCNLHHTNETTGALSYQQCELLLEAQELQHGLTADIHRCLAAQPGKVPDMEEVAQQLHMTSRTLRRHLLKESTCFKDVVRSHRMAMAKRYLLETSLSSNEIGELVGYSDTANFYRAFRASEHISPQSYRDLGSSR